MAIQNFTLVTELQTLTRRDFPLASIADLAPLSARPMIDGEWLEIDTSYNAKRAGDNNASTADEGTVPSYPVFAERGRYDTQAIGKTTLLMLGMFEADTLVVDKTALSVGDMLTVQDITYLALVRRGLKKVAATTGSGVVGVGYCTKLNSDGSVRFVHLGYQKLF